MSRGSRHGSERASVVAEVCLLLRELRQAKCPLDPELLEQARSLEERAAALGYGGIQVHLSEAIRSGTAGDTTPLLARLEVVEQLTEQARAELTDEDRSALDAMLAGPLPQGLAPPPALSASLAGPLGPESLAVEPPPLLNLDRLPSSGIPNATSEADALPRPASLQPPSAPVPPAILPGADSLPLPPSSPGAFAPEAPAPEAHAPRHPAPSPAGQASGNRSAGEAAAMPALAAPAPDSTEQRQAKSQFAVRSMFGLKGSSGAEHAAKGSAADPRSAARANDAPFAPAALPRGLSPSGPGRASTKTDAPSSLFGLGAQARSSRLAPPPLVGSDRNALPDLPDAGGTRRQAPRDDDMKRRLERIKQGSERTAESSKVRSRQPATTKRRTPRATATSSGTSATAWIVAAVAGGGLVVLSIVAFVVLRDGEAAAPPPPVATTQLASAAPAGADQPAAAPGLTVPEERFNELLRSVHGHGGQASPELAALLDEQAAIARQALQAGECENSADPHCAAWSELRETLLDDNPLYVEKRERSTTRPRWMEGLRTPQVPVGYDSRVEQVFEFFTQNPVGRARIQKMLFRCGAYQDLIRSTLERLELPLDLQAVVFAESGCNPTALSPAGAAGLWQFMPATARAYHLRVEEEVVDERLNPFKSTEAAVRLLAHLYQKLGDWELALASYNLGPFGVLSRVERAGGDVGFWDLVDADLLPEETANYVPTIQALALILRNLRSLKFAGTQMRAPQLTADLQAPGGTRLSLVARAAATSRRELQKLNPDIVGDVVPNLEGGFAVQVPKDVVWQARDTLKALLTQNNQDDLCVGPDFDWGRQEFTATMAKACHRKLKRSEP